MSLMKGEFKRSTGKGFAGTEQISIFFFAQPCVISLFLSISSTFEVLATDAAV